VLAIGLVLFQLRPEGGSSAAAAAAAAPKDQTLKLTVPSMKRVRDVPVYSTPVKEEAALRNGTAHVKGTGFPWQEEANVYIAGHRLGYPRTASFLVFWDLHKLRNGKRVVLEDSQGAKYVYEVFDRLVVKPGQVSVKQPIAGKNIVSLQTCTLPDYEDRLIVRAELVKIVDSPPAQASVE
jgi:sortase A